MHTHIVLDDELVNEALSLTGISSKRELINLALKELVQNRQKKDLFQLAGQLELDKDYDYKEARVMRHDFD
ncbi:MAG: type II toxin-antitoxin system VapB family antitoxin [Methylococcaceae bacterium]